MERGGFSNSRNQNVDSTITVIPNGIADLGTFTSINAGDHLYTRGNYIIFITNTNNDNNIDYADSDSICALILFSDTGV